MRPFIVLAMTAVCVTAGAFAATDIRAFLPQMNALTRVEPVYPEVARAQRITGSVRILTTIDPQGRVIDTEVLSGPAPLRQAAVDAVKQFTYRPVFRNGTPVIAATAESIIFSIRGERFVTGDISETIAEMHRLSQLREQFPRDPAQVLADTEQQDAAATGEYRFYALGDLAKSAFAAGNYDKARQYATDLLAMAVDFPKDWNYGNALHNGNMILGRIALHNGDVPAARQYLIESGRTPGSPQLNSFGPNVTLAKELISANERDTALQYFALCRSFWTMGGKKLDEWSATVGSGGMPDFGANLAY